MNQVFENEHFAVFVTEHGSLVVKRKDRNGTILNIVQGSDYGTTMTVACEPEKAQMLPASDYPNMVDIVPKR